MSTSPPPDPPARALRTSKTKSSLWRCRPAALLLPSPPRDPPALNPKVDRPTSPPLTLPHGRSGGRARAEERLSRRARGIPRVAARAQRRAPPAPQDPALQTGPSRLPRPPLAPPRPTSQLAHAARPNRSRHSALRVRRGPARGSDAPRARVTGRARGGQVIAREGDSSQDLVFILSGEVGRHSMPLDPLGPSMPLDPSRPSMPLKPNARAAGGGCCRTDARAGPRGRPPRTGPRSGAARA